MEIKRKTLLLEGLNRKTSEQFIIMYHAVIRVIQRGMKARGEIPRQGKSGTLFGRGDISQQPLNWNKSPTAEGPTPWGLIQDS